jgi:hypothetical protein
LKKFKYIVEDEDNGKYLGKKYYIGERETFFSEAYRFSAFELKLARSVLLKPTERYRVYQVEEDYDNFIL